MVATGHRRNRQPQILQLKEARYEKDTQDHRGVHRGGAHRGALGIFHHLKRQNTRGLNNQITAVYRKAFDDLTSDVASLQTKLCKLEAAGDTNQYTTLLMDVWRQTGDTESSIAALPVSYTATSPLTQFINRTGDYCRYLSQKLALGQEITDDDMTQLRALADSCSEVSAAIDELRTQGYLSAASVEDIAFLAEAPMAGTLDFTNQEFPRLIYDGPFSESTENKQPEGLGGEMVSAEQAAQTAADFLGVDAALLANDCDQEGTMPAYGFFGRAGRARVLHLHHKARRAGAVLHVQYGRRYFRRTERRPLYTTHRDGAAGTAPRRVTGRRCPAMRSSTTAWRSSIWPPSAEQRDTLPRPR